MKIYSKKHLICGMTALGLFLYYLWSSWMIGDHPLLIAMSTIPWLSVAAAEFRFALNKKYAAAILVVERDELEKVRRYKGYRIAFWACVYFLLWLSCGWEELTQDQPTFAYGFLAAAGLLLLLRRGVVCFHSRRFSE